MRERAKLFEGGAATEDAGRRARIVGWAARHAADVMAKLPGRFGHTRGKPHLFSARLVITDDDVLDWGEFQPHLAAFQNVLLSKGWSWVETEVVNEGAGVRVLVYTYDEPVLVHTRSGQVIPPVMEDLPAPHDAARTFIRDGAWWQSGVFTREYISPHDIVRVTVGEPLTS